MPTFKCSMFMRSDYYGFSENWFFSGTDYTSAMDALKNLASARLGLCGAGVYLDYLRVSDEAILRDSYVSNTKKQTVQLTGTSGDFSSKIVYTEWGAIDPPESGVHMRIEATAQYHSSHTIRGVPDSLIVWPGGPSNLPGWDKARMAWEDALVGKFCLRVRKQDEGSKKSPIVGMSHAQAAPWEFKVLAVPNLVGTKLRVSGLKGIPGSVNANGVYRILSVDPVTNLFKLDGFPPPPGNDGWFDYATPLSGYMQVPDWSYPVITDTIVRGQNRRKPGRPFDQRPGRRLVKR